MPPEDLPKLRLLLPDQDWQRLESVRALVYSPLGRVVEVLDSVQTLNFVVRVRFPSPAPVYAMGFVTLVNLMNQFGSVI